MVRANNKDGVSPVSKASLLSPASSKVKSTAPTMPEEETKNDEKLASEIRHLEAKTRLIEEQINSAKGWKAFFFNALKTTVAGIVAGVGLAAAYFFLFDPIIESKRAVNETGSKLEVIRSQIREENNRLKVQEIARDRELLEDDYIGLQSKFEQLLDDMNSMIEERKKALEIAERATAELKSIGGKYSELLAKLDSSEAEKERLLMQYQALIVRAEELQELAASQMRVSKSELDIVKQRASEIGGKLEELQDHSYTAKPSIPVTIYVNDGMEVSALVDSLKDRGFTNIKVIAPRFKSGKGVAYESTIPTSFLNEVVYLLETFQRKAVEKKVPVSDKGVGIIIHLNNDFK